MKNTDLHRRSFLKSTAVAAAGITIIPSHVMGKALGHVAPSDKLNIAGVGVGGKGRVNLQAMNTENIVALCDVDWKYARDCFDDYPSAKRYWDWRIMLEEMEGACSRSLNRLATEAKRDVSASMGQGS